MEEINALAKSISDTMTLPQNAFVPTGEIDTTALFSISYDLCAHRKGREKDNGCIINTVIQATSTPLRVTFTVNKGNLTHDMVLKTGIFNLSISTENSKFPLYQRFAWLAAGTKTSLRTLPPLRAASTALPTSPRGTNALLSGKVINTLDCGTHTLFLADLTEARKLSKEPSVTYEYYRANIKPSAQRGSAAEKGWLCTVCGYIYDGEVLPPDFICPVCKHGAEVFIPPAAAEEKRRNRRRSPNLRRSRSRKSPLSPVRKNGSARCAGISTKGR